MEFALVSDWKRWPCEEAQLEEIYAKEFSRLGHRIHWIAFIPGLPEPVRRETWHGHPVTLRRREDGTVRPLLAWLSALLEERPLAFVQVRNDPLFALLALFLARRAGKPFVYHLSVLNGPIVLDRARQERGLKRAKMLLKGSVGGWLVDRVAMACDLLLPISDHMAEHYRAMGRRGPTVPMQMGCRDAVVSPPPPERPTVELLYLGALDWVRRLDFLLRSLAVALKSDPRLRLTFLGSALQAGDVQRLRSLVAELGLSEAVRFSPLVPRAEVSARIDDSDIGVSPLPPVPHFYMNSPTKLMESLGRGRPVVGTLETPEQKAILESSGGGIAVPFDENAFAAALVALSKDRERRLEAGRRGAAYMAAHRDYAILAKVAETAYRDHLKV
jgi:glycosyltransferase involved in cell wall biosynthesis